IPFLVMLVAKGLDIMNHESTVRFERTGNSIGRLQLGRLEGIFGLAEPGGWAVLFGIAFGFQVGLLYFTPNHAGLDIGGGLWHCSLLTLDNVCHGFLLDNVNLAGPVEHTLVSGTVFYLFRIALDAFGLLLLYAAYQRYSVRHLLADYPGHV